MSNEEMMDRQTRALGLDELKQAAQEYAPHVDWSRGLDIDSEFKSLLDTGISSVDGIMKRALRSGLLILSVVVLSGVADGVMVGGSTKGINAVPIASSLAIAAVAVTDVNALIGMGNDAIERMKLFSNVLLPTMAAATAASGSPVGAAAKQMAAVLFSDVLMALIHRFLMPLVYAYISICVVHAALGNEGLKRIAGTLKWAVTSVLTTVLIAFTGYLSVSGVIAGTTDAIAVKATKFTVSTMVPVVGGILSDAADTVLAGAGMLKNTVGVFGMLVILGMSIVPFLQLGIHYLIYKMTAALSATVTDTRIAGLIDGIGSAFGLVLGMTGACALLLLITMFSAVKVAAL